MGTSHSDMNSTTMWNQCPSAFPKAGFSDEYKTKISVVQLQRLDSVGEDINHFQPFTNGSAGSSVNKIMLKLEANAFKTSCGLRSGTACMSFSKSMPISMSSPSIRESRRLNPSYLCDRNSVKLMKSHSLPEVISKSKCGSSASSSNMQSSFNYKPDRSWSIGSCGDERRLYEEQPHGELYHLTKNLLSSVPGSCISNLPTMDCLFKCNGCQAKRESLNMNSSDVSESQLSQKCYNSLENSSLPQGQNNCTPVSPPGYEMDKDQATLDLEKDSSLTHMERSSQNTSTSACSSRIVPHEQENKHGYQGSVPNLQSVLFSPRKTCKKGRPSSKKQKKRKRQKQKHASEVSLSTFSTMTCPDVSHKSPEKVDCDINAHDSESDLNSSVISSKNDSSLSPPQIASTPIKKASPCPIVFNLFSSSTSSDSDEDSESDKDEDDDFEWCENDDSETSRISISSVSSLGISLPLNLDSVFKQKHVPSLQSLLSDEGSDDPDAASSSKLNNLFLSGSISLSDEEDIDDDSIEFAASPSPAPLSQKKCFIFSSVLGEASGPIEEFDSITDDLDAENVDMQEINAKWNEMYSGPDACKCCNKNQAMMADSHLMKVKFPEGPGLSTVHIVFDIGSEDRVGTWHHYALDRERFERRIKEASQVLSPILDESHRSGIAKRNAILLEQHGKA